MHMYMYVMRENNRSWPGVRDCLAYALLLHSLYISHTYPRVFIFMYVCLCMVHVHMCMPGWWRRYLHSVAASHGVRVWHSLPDACQHVREPMHPQHMSRCKHPITHA